MVKIAPSILSADFANLEEEVKALEQAGADMIHIDVMDGHFVPNITIGPCVIRAIRKHTTIPFDVHLMISSPENYIEEFVKAGADFITLHYEAVEESLLKELLKKIKKLNVRTGLSLMPATEIKKIDAFLDALDLVLVMTVEPGFGGQRFMPEQLMKIKHLSEVIKKEGLKTFISVDGGINDRTAYDCISAGADILVSGSFIWSGDYSKQIKKLRQC